MLLLQLLPLLFPASELFAQFPRNDCRDLSRLTQPELNYCAAERARSADARLNQVYRRLRSVYRDDKVRENLLIDAQLAWIKFRDTNCKFSENRFAGGSIAALIYHECIERVTKQRTAELEGYIPKN